MYKSRKMKYQRLHRTKFNEQMFLIQNVKTQVCGSKRYYKHINSGHHILALNICNSSYKLVPHVLQNSYQLTIYSSCQSIPRKSIAHPKMVQDTSVRNTNCIYEIILQKEKKMFTFKSANLPTQKRLLLFFNHHHVCSFSIY